MYICFKICIEKVELHDVCTMYIYIYIQYINRIQCTKMQKPGL